MKINIKNLSETENIGYIISSKLKEGDVLCLDGDLGAGKTTLTQFIAKGLHINDYITSPTFTIIKEYNGRLPLYHMDVYRIETIEEMYDLGYEEYIYSNGVTIIEWSIKINDILPLNRIHMDIKIGSTYDNREIVFSGSGQTYELLKKELSIYENTSN